MGLKRFIKNIFRGKNNHKFFTKSHRAFSQHEIGDYSYGHPHLHFQNTDAHLIVGKFCSIAEEVHILLGGNHRVDWISAYPFPRLSQYFPSAQGIENYTVSKGNVTIKNDVWIGRNVIILSGVTIGNGAIIAAGSVVTKDIGAYEIWGGNPAKLIKKRFPDADIEYLLRLSWWDLPLERLSEIIPLLCNSDIKTLQDKMPLTFK